PTWCPTVADRGDRIQVEVLDEHCHPTKQCLLRVGQLRIRPFKYRDKQRRGDELVISRIEVIVQPSSKLLKSQVLETRCRQLDCQWDSTQDAADMTHDR